MKTIQLIVLTVTTRDAVDVGCHEGLFARHDQNAHRSGCFAQRAGRRRDDGVALCCDQLEHVRVSGPRREGEFVSLFP